MISIKIAGGGKDTALLNLEIRGGVRISFELQSWLLVKDEEKLEHCNSVVVGKPLPKVHFYFMVPAAIPNEEGFSVRSFFDGMKTLHNRFSFRPTCVYSVDLSKYNSNDTNDYRLQIELVQIHPTLGEKKEPGSLCYFFEVKNYEIIPKVSQEKKEHV